MNPAQRVGNFMLTVTAGTVVLMALSIPVILTVAGLGIIFNWTWLWNTDPQLNRVAAGLLLLWTAWFVTGLGLWSIGSMANDETEWD